MREHWRSTLALTLSVAVLSTGCQDRDPPTAPATGSATGAGFKIAPAQGPYEEIGPAVWDIAAAPDGGILVARNTTILEIRTDGIEEIRTVPTTPGSPVNGIAPVGRASLFATSGGLDLAAGAGVWHVSRGRARLVGDVAAFETDNDPDAFEGPMWKNQACEEDPGQGFSAGPQSNPYHLTAVDGGTALVADAAGNSLLSVETNGTVDWVAVFTPPVDASGDYRFLKPALSDSGIDCYVQPVPNSVAIGPDGDWYVGELTGAPAVPGWSRVWRIEKGSRHVTCPSAACEMLADGFTSIIDLEFGPDGWLYVVELDEASWLAAIGVIPPAGGTVNRCDPGTGLCEVVAPGLELPGAIAFDDRGTAWILENSFDPTVRTLD